MRAKYLSTLNVCGGFILSFFISTLISGFLFLHIGVVFNVRYLHNKSSKIDIFLSTIVHNTVVALYLASTHNILSSLWIR